MTCTRMATEATNARPTLPAPTKPTIRRGRTRPASALTRKPASGSSRTRGASVSTAGLLLHQVELVDVHLPAGTIDLDDDRDANHNFGGCHRDHQEGEDDAEDRPPDPLAAAPAEREVGHRVEQRDDEDEEHHDGAGIDDHLGGEQELGVQHQEEDGQPEHVRHQGEGVIDWSAKADDARGGHEFPGRHDGEPDYHLRATGWADGAAVGRAVSLMLALSGSSRSSLTAMNLSGWSSARS